MKLSVTLSLAVSLLVAMLAAVARFPSVWAHDPWGILFISMGSVAPAVLLALVGMLILRVFDVRFGLGFLICYLFGFAIFSCSVAKTEMLEAAWSIQDMTPPPGLPHKP